MSQNYRILSRKACSGLLVASGVALLSFSSATAQMNHGGATSPSQQTVPGSQPVQPEMSPMEQATDTDAQMTDKAFVRKALQGGMAEVQLGQLALQKSSNDDVKQFAQRMVDDHTKLGDEMKQVAQQLNVKVPDSPSGKDKSTMNKLQALNADEFDKAYIKDMVKDHQQDEKDFKTEAKNTTNPAVKQVAAQGEQVISEHLQMIEQIAQKNNVVASR